MKPPYGRSEGNKGSGTVVIKPKSVEIEINAYRWLRAFVIATVVFFGFFLIRVHLNMVLPVGGLGCFIFFFVLTLWTAPVSYKMNPCDTKAWYFKKERVVFLETSEKIWIAIRLVSEGETKVFLDTLKEAYGKNMAFN